MRIRSHAAATFAALALVGGGCAAHHEMRGASLAADGSRGTALLRTKCGGCHAIPDPAAMTGEKWSAALERMKRRIQLPAADWDSLAAMAGGPAPAAESTPRP